MIDVGAIICKRIKDIKPECTWYEVARLFSRIKHDARKYFAELDDLAFLRSIERNYSRQALEDCFT